MSSLFPSGNFHQNSGGTAGGRESGFVPIWKNRPPADANAIAGQLMGNTGLDIRPSYLKGMACLELGDFDAAVAELTDALGALDVVVYVVSVAR